MNDGWRIPESEKKYFQSYGPCLTFDLSVPSADNLCGQFGPRSGLTKSQISSGSKLFDILREFLKTINLREKKNSADDNKI